MGAAGYKISAASVQAGNPRFIYLFILLTVKTHVSEKVRLSVKNKIGKLPV